MSLHVAPDRCRSNNAPFILYPSQASQLRDQDVHATCQNQLSVFPTFHGLVSGQNQRTVATLTSHGTHSASHQDLLLFCVHRRRCSRLKKALLATLIPRLQGARGTAPNCSTVGAAHGGSSTAAKIQLSLECNVCTLPIKKLKLSTSLNSKLLITV